MSKRDQKLGPLQETWMKRAESGEHRQSSGCLHGDYGVCFVGLLFSNPPIIRATKPAHYRKFLTQDERDQIGLNRFGESILIGYNDSDERSFDEIASIVRNEPYKFFVRSA